MASDSKPASGGRVSGPTSIPHRGSPRAIRRGSQSGKGEEAAFQVEIDGSQRSIPGSRKRGQRK